MILSFDKLHGAQNDFIFAPFEKNLADIPEIAKTLCAHHKSVGADGVIFYDSKDPGIMIVNSDGSFAETCGNALRAFGLLLMKNGHWDGASKQSVKNIQSGHQIATLMNGKLLSDVHAEVCVSMGTQASTHKNLPRVEDIHHEAGLLPRNQLFVELFNPHWVFESPEFQNFSFQNFQDFGRAAQGSLRAQSSVPVSNIGCLWLENNLWNLVVFERGAGLTKCCGSGAMAAFIALQEWKLESKNETQFRVPGGTVSIKKEGPEYLLSGPAQWVMEGKAFY